MTAKITCFTHFRLGVEKVRDTVCFFGMIYLWLVMLSEYTITAIKANATMSLSYLL